MGDELYARLETDVHLCAFYSTAMRHKVAILESDRITERVPPSAGAMGRIHSRIHWWELSKSISMEECRSSMTCSAKQEPVADLSLLCQQFAANLIRSCRVRETKTPLLHTAMTGTDGFLGRPLTDSELAEEGMGGMFGGSTYPSSCVLETHADLSTYLIRWDYSKHFRLLALGYTTAPGHRWPPQS